VRRCQKKAVGNILRDDLIRLKTPASRKEYRELMRRIVALVEVDQPVNADLTAKIATLPSVKQVKVMGF
jgi:hypothetical protein